MTARQLLQCVLPIWIAAFSLGAGAAGGETRVTLKGHTLAGDALAQATRVPTTVKAATEDEMTLTVVLRRSDESGFARFLAELYDRESPNFRRFVGPEAVSERFGPFADAYASVTGYFTTAGLRVVETSKNRMTLVVSGPREAIERSLAVTLSDYVLGSKRFVSNDQDPSLPPAIAQHVQAVLGLSALASAERMGTVPQPLWQQNPTTIPPACTPDPVNDPLGIGTGICNNLRNAYVGLISAIYNAFCSLFWNWFGNCKNLNIPPVDPVPATVVAHKASAPQKIGLAQFDSFRMSDVADFLALVNAPPATINRLSAVAINGGAPLGANQSEVLLDINAVMATAVDAQVVVYSAPFKGAGSFQAIFNRMVTDGVTVISNSWGYCENQTTLADAQSIDSILATAAASGISMFTASGDTGSTCLNGAPNVIILPASAPHATAVGGTSVVIGPGNTYAGETWWAGKGGFGVSQFFTRPAYQNGFTVAAMRSIPDLALNADPAAYGVMICQADAGGCPTGLSYGGTSAAAPYMAAMMALINESRGSNIGWVNPQVYPLAALPAFHSPASMGSDFAHVGIGSPNVSLLALALNGTTAGPASAANSRVQTDTPFLYADGVALASVVVQLRDANGATISGKTISLAKNAGSAATITPSTAVTSVANGTAVFTVKTLVPGTSTFTATDVTDGLPITQTATIIAVSPPATSASINASPNIVQNDGVATTTITVTLQDALARPSPGKLVQIAQGTGRSVISGPSPPVTNAAGQIQFTATNLNPEVVTYTAVDVTDGNLPVPGSGSVTFGGQGSTSCVTGPLPQAAPGFVMTPFSTGYATGNLFFGNVNWGCRGATFPGFATDGSVFVTNFVDGSLFKLPAQGGAPTSGNRLSTLGPSSNVPVFGKDGKLYVARGATTGNFFTGAIIEINPVTGAVVRTVMTGLTCPTPLVVDPLSGDLFTGDSCFGAGSDNPSIWRIANPASATPTLSVYTTLPSTPTAWLSFAPDGTLFVPQHTTNPAGSPVLRISGTNVPGTPTQTPIPGLNSLYWVTVGEVLPSGAAKSLIILDGVSLKVRLADITTNPPTFTDLTTTGMPSGVVGPDGCLYIGTTDSIYKLAPASGGCGFGVTNPAPALRLTPATVSPNPTQGTALTFTAQFDNLAVPAGTPVVFSSYGTNAQIRLGHTGATGAASIGYTGTRIGGETLVATATVGSTTYTSNTVELTWTAGKHATFLSLNNAPTGGAAGVATTLTATLTDSTLTPAAAIAGASIQFTLGAQSCNAVTNGSGVASCNVTPPAAGGFTVTANYAGNGTYLPAAAAQSFLVSGPPSTTLTSSASPVAVGTALTLTATVTGTAPTGTVLFRNESVTLPGCTAAPLTGAGNSRTAQCTVTSLGVGSYALTADYSGGGGNLPSTATIIQVVSANAGPPCGGFSDVDPQSPFCPNVEWLKNRQVTLGCTAALYCPDAPVIRLSMAAFMNRLGTAGTDILFTAQAQPGAINLDAPTVVCQTGDFAVVNFPRLATVDAVFSGQGAAAVSFITEAVASFDAGNTWAPLVNTTVAGSATATHWGNVRAAGVRDLDVGQSVRFGVRVGRGGLAGSGGLTASQCNLRALVGNRVVTYSPLDP